MIGHERQVREGLEDPGLLRLQKEVQFDFKGTRHETLKETNGKELQKLLQIQGNLPPMSSGHREEKAQSRGLERTLGVRQWAFSFNVENHFSFSHSFNKQLSTYLILACRFGNRKGRLLFYGLINTDGRILAHQYFQRFPLEYKLHELKVHMYFTLCCIHCT